MISFNHSKSCGYLTFFLQKKAKLALLDQERTKARMEKLQEEDRKIRETLEESDKLCSEVMRTHCNLT